MLADLYFLLGRDELLRALPDDGSASSTSGFKFGFS
jgi:hypothetical protein